MPKHLSNLGYEFVSASTWAPSFFESFCSLRNSIHKNEPYFLRESLEDLKKYFGTTSPFSRNNTWMCWLVYHNGQPVLRVAISFPNYWKPARFACLGFYESEENVPFEVVLEAKNRWLEFAKKHNLPEIRTPMNGGFFGSYRAKTPSPDKPFYGEPDTLPHYFEQWKKLGFLRSNSWQSFSANIEAMTKNSSAILKHFHGTEQIPGVSIRPLDLKNWDNELKTICEMFLKSYANMLEYMPISEEEFLWFYRSLRHVLRMDMCFILEEKGKPIAFLVSYYDPLDILLEHQNSVMPVWIKNIIAYFKLKKASGPIVLPYIGKIPEADHYKGLTAYMLLHMFRNLPRKDKECIFAYMAEGSPSFKTMKIDEYKEIATYSVFSLKVL